MSEANWEVPADNVPDEPGHPKVFAATRGERPQHPVSRWEAFEWGWSFQSRLGSCHDSRDIGRLFGCDDWPRSAAFIANKMNGFTTKERGIVDAKRLIREFLEQPAPQPIMAFAPGSPEGSRTVEQPIHPIVIGVPVEACEAIVEFGNRMHPATLPDGTKRWMYCGDLSAESPPQIWVDFREATECARRGENPLAKEVERLTKNLANAEDAFAAQLKDGLELQKQLAGVTAERDQLKQEAALRDLRATEDAVDANKRLAAMKDERDAAIRDRDLAKRRHQETIDGELKSALERIERLRSELNANDEILRQQNFWRWQGDGTDHPESLVCQVVMTSEQVRGLITLADAQRERADGLAAQLRGTEIGAKAYRQAAERCEDQLIAERDSLRTQLADVGKILLVRSNESVREAALDVMERNRIGGQFQELADERAAAIRELEQQLSTERQKREAAEADLKDARAWNIKHAHCLGLGEGLQVWGDSAAIELAQQHLRNLERSVTELAETRAKLAKAEKSLKAWRVEETQSANERLRDEMIALTARTDRLAEVLRKCECTTAAHGMCPLCGSQIDRQQSHAPDCELASAIKPAEPTVATPNAGAGQVETGADGESAS